MRWVHAQGEFEIKKRIPLIMGILNVTPDSFSDGGKFFDSDAALKHVETLINRGADLIDVGGESTRPGAEPVEEEEEIRRVVDIIRAIHQRWPDVPVSIDTYKSKVAERALEAGAAIINDISGGAWGEEGEKMLGVLRESKAGYVCMHTLDRPQQMQKDPSYENVREDILSFLKDRQKKLNEERIEEERIVFDVGIGFGKKVEHNLSLIRATQIWDQLERPMLWGLSRKSFISHVLGVPVEERIPGGLASYGWLLAQKREQIWRVHDVKEIVEFVKMWQAVETTA